MFVLHFIMRKVENGKLYLNLQVVSNAMYTIVFRFNNMLPSLFQLDCGIHPGMSGMESLPFLDEIDTAEIDLLLVSQ